MWWLARFGPEFSPESCPAARDSRDPGEEVPARDEMPAMSDRRLEQLFELPDEIATRVAIVFYADARDALLKALNE